MEHTFGFLDATKVAETGVASRAWHSAAASPSLWLALAEARWPAVAAMQSIVRARGPREFYRARATADHVKREPSAFDASKHLMTLELEQHGRVVCSVAREAADVFREELADDDSRTTAPGLLFDELDARFDCRSGRFIGELSQASVKFTVCVVRKSDGLVAPLVPPYYLEADEGWGFGERARSYCPDRCFPANQKLSGLLPFRMRGIPNQLGFISHRDDPGVIGACVSIGDTDEFPPHNGFANTVTGATFENGFLPPWTPLPDPSVVIGDDGFITLHKFKIHFEASARDRDEDYDEEEEEEIPRGLSMAAIHRQLACKLRFS